MVFFSFATAQVSSQQEVETIQESEFSIEGWVLGDVTDLDLESNQLIVSYIDYNTDEAGEITIGVDTDTNYENVDSLADIEVGDVVAIDYKIGSKGEAIALNISVERLKDKGGDIP